MSVLLAMWCNTGLECVVDLEDYSKKATWEVLKGNKPPEAPVNINLLKIRARANLDRHYEIYTFNSGEFDVAAIEELFDSSPQIIVDWIRGNGDCIHSDRQRVAAVIV